MISLSRGVSCLSARSISFERDSLINDLSAMGESSLTNTSSRLLSSPSTKGASTEICRPDTFNVSEILFIFGQLKYWYCSTYLDGVEKFEKYALKNAVIYDYFYDKWILFEEIVNNIPYEFGDAESFLKTHSKLEFNKNGYWYLLNITEYRLLGEEMPYDFARAQVQEILTNSNRLSFDGGLDEGLYREAGESGV